MLKLKLMAFLLSLQGTFCHCNYEKKHLDFESNKGLYKVRKIGRLPRGLIESSALETAKDNTYWTLQDSGGKPFLFRIDHSGKLLDTLKIRDAVNKDWEELAQDDQGHLYIGDFGNNLNKRNDLKVYKWHLASGSSEVMAIEYKNQTSFPPVREQMNYDCEAYFWFNGSLHLFSKNRGVKKVQHYELPDQPGTYSLTAVDEFVFRGKVTAADISPDGQLMALLGYGKVWLFRLEDKNDLWTRPFKCLKINRGQTEGIVFVSNTDLLISNETGRLYLLSQNAERE